MNKFLSFLIQLGHIFLMAGLWYGAHCLHPSLGIAFAGLWLILIASRTKKLVEEHEKRTPSALPPEAIVDEARRFAELHEADEAKRKTAAHAFRAGALWADAYVKGGAKE